MNAQHNLPPSPEHVPTMDELDARLSQIASTEYEPDLVAAQKHRKDQEWGDVDETTFDLGATSVVPGVEFVQVLSDTHYGMTGITTLHRDAQGYAIPSRYYGFSTNDQGQRELVITHLDTIDPKTNDHPRVRTTDQGSALYRQGARYMQMLLNVSLDTLS